MKKIFISFIRLSCLVIGIVWTNTLVARPEPILNEYFEKSTGKSSNLVSLNLFLNENFRRYDAASPSNSGHTVIDECGGTFDGEDYQGQLPASARLTSVQIGGRTYLRIVLKNAKPDSLYTAWLRVKGLDQDGNAFGGSPLTNGGATPLAPGSKLDELEAISPWNNPGSANLANGFQTDGNGYGRLILRLDFPLIGGSYPFNKISRSSLENIRNLQNASAKAIPVAIVNPRDSHVDSPFAIRIVSHCQDGLGHGLSPANRETWFDWPAK